MSTRRTRATPGSRPLPDNTRASRWHWNETAAFLAGPAITALVLAGVSVLHASGVATDFNVNISAIALSCAVFAAVTGGMLPGLITALMALAYAVWYVSPDEHPFALNPDMQNRMVTLGLALAVVVPMVGVLQRRRRRNAAVDAAVTARVEVERRFHDLVQARDAIV